MRFEGGDVALDAAIKDLCASRCHGWCEVYCPTCGVVAPCARGDCSSCNQSPHVLVLAKSRRAERVLWGGSARVPDLPRPKLLSGYVPDVEVTFMSPMPALERIPGYRHIFAVKWDDRYIGWIDGTLVSDYRKHLSESFGLRVRYAVWSIMDRVWQFFRRFR